MSRIFKANSVKIDKNNRVVVDVSNYDFINTPKTEQPFQEPQVQSENLVDEASAVQVSEKIIKDAQNTKNSIINEAKLEASKIIENAKKEAENIYKERFNLGYNDGYSESKESAYNDVLKETNAMKDEAKEIIESAKLEKEETLKNIEPEIVDLIYKITRDLIKTEMKYDTSLILALVKEGINSTTILEKLTIKLSSDDYDLILEEREELEKLIDPSKDLKIIKDFTLKNNDCIIETDFGYVSCGIDDKLKALKKNLEVILKSR